MNKPCPFCGSTELISSSGITEGATAEIIRCSKCFVFQYTAKWNVRPSESKLKEGIQKLLNGVEFALDENFSRKSVTARLRECRNEAIRILTVK